VEFILLAVGLVVGGIAGVFGGIAYRKKLAAKAEQNIKNAEQEARKIVNEAIKSAEEKKREAKLEAKEEILRERTNFDNELKERRRDISNQERNLQAKEQKLDKKQEQLEEKDELANKRIKDVETLRQETAELKNAQLKNLERIAGLSIEEAKVQLLKDIEMELDHAKAERIKSYEEHLASESEAMAREVIGNAIQRCASDHVTEATVSVVVIPSDEMKGRIIGREGRNIRTLEQLTGVDLIIDDTPEAITLSSFDPVRREVARLALEKLITDGRIHPTRIEEMVEKVKKEVDQVIKKQGERAIFETGVRGIHPELIKLMGRMHYRRSYGQNVLQHSIEVALLAGHLAAEIGGVDVAMAKRAGFLHDIGKAVDREMDGTHTALGVELATKYREGSEVIHAIESHHGDVELKTTIAAIVMAADAISAARPGARRENMEHYIKRLEDLEKLAGGFKGVERAFAVQAGREVRVVVKPEIVTDDQMTLLAHEMTKKIEEDLTYPGQVKVHIIRETRHIAIAK